MNSYRTRPEPRSSLQPAPANPAFASTPLIAQPRVLVEPPVLLNLSLLFAALLIFNHFGRPFETVLVGFKIPAIICGISILVVLFGGALKSLKSPIAITLAANVLWMVLLIPFSTWKGGSARYVLWYVAFWVVLMLIVANASRSVNQVARIGYVTAFSCIFHLIVHGGSFSGRYALSGTFGNSDDVALLAGYTIPFVVLFATQRRQPILRFGIIAVGVMYLLLLVGRTATRAAIPALIGMLAVYFIRTRMIHRMAIVAFSFVAVILILFVLPGSTLERFATILDSFTTKAAAQQLPATEAIDSVIERRELMKDAITITLRNPITGVGPGEFPDYRTRWLRYENGYPKRFFPSHNTYLQISSEDGIPGMIIYVVFLVTIYRTLRNIRKLNAGRTHPQSLLIQQITICLEAALAYFVICAFFMTCDRHPHQFIIAGMAIALERLVKLGLKQSPGPVPQLGIPVPAQRAFGGRPQASLTPARLR